MSSGRPGQLRIRGAPQAGPKAPPPRTDRARRPVRAFKWRQGEWSRICSALVEGGRCVHGLCPCRPAPPHPTTIAGRATDSRLPDRNACPACRVFRIGATRHQDDAFRDPEDRCGRGRRLAMACCRAAGANGPRPQCHLAILGSPKPTTTAFYLEPRDGFDAARSRWPHAGRATPPRRVPAGEAHCADASSTDVSTVARQ